MNNIRMDHPGKPDADGKVKYTLAGYGKLFINGHEVEGVLEFTPHLTERDSVAHVTIKLAVSKFTYGPEEQFVEWVALDGDGRSYRAPVVPMRD